MPPEKFRQEEDSVEFSGDETFQTCVCLSKFTRKMEKIVWTGFVTVAANSVGTTVKSGRVDGSLVGNGVMVGAEVK